MNDPADPLADSLLPPGATWSFEPDGQWIRYITQVVDETPNTIARLLSGALRGDYKGDDIAMQQNQDRLCRVCAPPVSCTWAPIW